MRAHGGQSSSRLQFAGVGDFAFVGGADLRGLDGDDGGGVAIERGELHLVGQPVAIDMHDRPHVARLQIFGGDGGRQNYAVMFFDHKSFNACADRPSPI